MTGEPDSSENLGLIPTGADRALAKSSTDMVRRGLDLARRLDTRGITARPQPRVVRFPEDHSIGTLYVRDCGDEGGDWPYLGDARGVVMVQPDQDLRLESEGVDIALAGLAPGDLQYLNTGLKLVGDADLVHLKHLTGLQHLHMSKTDVTDAGLAYLQHLTSLQWLDVSKTHVTDAGLAYLQHLTSLRVLRLSGTGVRDAGLTHLQHLTDLRSLGLENTLVTDAGLTHLQHLTSLRLLWLWGTLCSEAGVARLQALLPDCDIGDPR